ncbi:hypothetical protein CEXT_775011 [Caerostris extrusa]|uniref:Uncharacterized protein n=1 Tax=Caerostris extrusa TaxID=172846 RepID=A0AAV4RJM7_CAEEX|nr:hypothetical protein CEXT_775011 [Caerostris extrusa]
MFCGTAGACLGAGDGWLCHHRPSWDHNGEPASAAQAHYLNKAELGFLMCYFVSKEMGHLRQSPENVSVPAVKLRAVTYSGSLLVYSFTSGEDSQCRPRRSASLWSSSTEEGLCVKYCISSTKCVVT